MQQDPRLSSRRTRSRPRNAATATSGASCALLVYDARLHGRREQLPQLPRARAQPGDGPAGGQIRRALQGLPAVQVAPGARRASSPRISARGGFSAVPRRAGGSGLLKGRFARLAPHESPDDEDVVLLGHSMGGLTLAERGRAACAAAPAGRRPRAPAPRPRRRQLRRAPSSACTRASSRTGLSAASSHAPAPPPPQDAAAAGVASSQSEPPRAGRRRPRPAGPGDELFGAPPATAGHALQRGRTPTTCGSRRRARGAGARRCTSCRSTP